MHICACRTPPLEVERTQELKDVTQGIRWGDAVRQSISPEGGWMGADGEKERKTKPGQDERSGGTSGAPLPRCLLSPSCCGSSDSFKGKTVLSQGHSVGGLAGQCLR